MEPKEERNRRQQLKGFMFLTGVAGVSILSGAAVTIGLAKKQDPTHFSKGLLGSKQLSESGASLAMRALGRGTLYSVAGVGMFCFVFWKALGVNNLVEFRERMQSILPSIPRSGPEGRRDFDSFRELFEYLNSDEIATKTSNVKDKEQNDRPTI